MNYRLAELPEGVRGVDATLAEIGRLIETDLRETALRFHATQILRGVPSKDVAGEARRIFAWVRSNVRYQRDPLGIETVQSPVVTLRLRAGDCDDQAALVVGLAAAVGIPGRFRVIGTNQEKFIHIWPELLVGGRWLPADTTEAGGLGWRPKRFPVERVYSLAGKVDGMAGENLPDVLPVTVGEVKQRVYNAVWATLRGNWIGGLINLADVQSYLRVIDEGNFPIKKPMLVDPTRQAIIDFIAYAPGNLGPSRKPAGQLGGLSGLDGFLGSVFKAVTGVVGGVVKTVAKAVGISSEKPVIVQPQINIPTGAVQTQVTPEAARAAVAGVTESPLLWIGLAAAAIILVTRR